MKKTTNPSLVILSNSKSTITFVLTIAVEGGGSKVTHSEIHTIESNCKNNYAVYAIKRTCDLLFFFLENQESFFWNENVGTKV